MSNGTFNSFDSPVGNDKSRENEREGNVLQGAAPRCYDEVATISLLRGFSFSSSVEAPGLRPLELIQSEPAGSTGGVDSRIDHLDKVGTLTNSALRTFAISSDNYGPPIIARDGDSMHAENGQKVIAYSGAEVWAGNGSEVEAHGSSIIHAQNGSRVRTFDQNTVVRIESGAQVRSEVGFQYQPAHAMIVEINGQTFELRPGTPYSRLYVPPGQWAYFHNP